MISKYPFRLLFFDRGKWVYAFILLCVLSIVTVLAEGTKELMPKSTDHGVVQIFDRSRLFMTYDAPKENRLNIHICKAGEIIYFGFNQPDEDVYFKLKSPDGTVVMGPTLIPASGAGFIANYNQAVAGPLQLSAGGYNALSYTSLTDGDYYIEFNPVSPTTKTDSKRYFNLFDITVAEGNIAKPGRLWSYTWDINTTAANYAFNGKMYVLSTDSIVTSIDFNGIQPFGATISANSKGCTSTGIAINDRVSRVGNVTYPEYKIFLNDPDPTCYPTGTFGNFLQKPFISGCDPDNRCININVDKPGNIEVLLDINGQDGYQSNTTDRIISASVVKGQNCIKWNTRDGKGNIVPPGASVEVELSYGNGITHLPLYDVEHHKNGYIVDLVRPIGPKPQLFWDDSQLKGGTAIDGLANLTGCSNAAGCHQWKDRGTDDCKKECPETINTWWYARMVKEKVDYLVSLPKVDAESRNKPGEINDTLVCVNISTFQLSGTLTNASSAQWTGGNGVFNVSRVALTPEYTPTAEERNSGSVKLYLRSDAQVNCPSAIDSMLILFKKLPEAEAGDSLVLCETTKIINLTGVVKNVTGSIWSGGNGVFGDKNKLATTYTPSAAELKSNSFLLRLTSANASPCPEVFDNIKIIYKHAPTVEAGLPISVCADKDSIILSGSSLNATGLKWTGGKGSFSDDTKAQTYYRIKPDEKAGDITLSLRAEGAAPCISVSDEIKISVNPLPDISAGDDLNSCTGDVAIFEAKSSPSPSPSYSYEWIDEKGIVIGNAATLKVTSSGDRTFILVGKDNKGCSASDTVRLIVNSGPVLSLPPDICLSDTLKLNALPQSSSFAGIYIWKKDGVVLLNKNTSVININESGVYEVDFQNGNCKASGKTVVWAPPALTMADSIIECENTKVVLSANQIENVSYIWTIDGIKLPSTASSIEAISSNIIQRFFIEVKDSHGCMDKDSLVLVGIPIPKIIAEDTGICPGKDVVLDPIVKNTYNFMGLPVEYTWYENGQLTEIHDTVYNASFAGNYKVSVKIGSCYDQKSVSVKAFSAPTRSLPESVKFCKEGVQFYELTAGPGKKYFWYGTGDTSRSINVALPGKYSVLITNESGCTIEDATDVREVCPPRLYISNSFSPNKDGKNDTYDVFGANFTNFRMLIFNRWGEIIFESRDRNEVWDGQYRGEPMPIGVYPWVITYEGDSEEYKGPYKMEGSVTIVR
ncbi:MAG: gliding motility-associated C-terminal domain-containing protein [Sporocytophaga sp.]|uniref:gliding motility-associated C-terminal domain-containing protein n=1 Tax=Sporocytophaga sp. TaxID=2231183 RepID=UPI001AFDA695|nr:gliding motility-associated C-terminal domain-containing protein [Sporocytophaga sp.]MBO9699879.1 gliding motility-associated C-terminal domain-containing protein [Sporocytophaga sp.]